MEEMYVLQEYFESLGLKGKVLTNEDLALLKSELKDAGEFGLAQWVGALKNPIELLDYIKEEE